LLWRWLKKLEKGDRTNGNGDLKTMRDISIKVGQYYWCEINLKFSPTWEEPFKGSVMIVRKTGDFWVARNIERPEIEFYVKECHLYHLPELTAAPLI
jgi:hypothetical protein